MSTSLPTSHSEFVSVPSEPPHGYMYQNKQNTKPASAGSSIPASQALAMLDSPRKGAPGPDAGVPICPSTRFLAGDLSSSNRFLDAACIHRSSRQGQGREGTTGTAVVVGEAPQVQGIDGLLHRMFLTLLGLLPVLISADRSRCLGP
jgi:hypothetical protein